MAPEAPGRGPTTEPASAPYTPFPDLATWQQQRVDLSTVDRFFDSLDEARSQLGPDAIRAAVEVATKWAAVDTGAIEGLYEVDRGFTYSVAVEAAAWEAIGETRGEPVKRAIEDAVAAHELVLDAATRSVPVSEKWIRELHATICRSVTSYEVRTAVGWQNHPLVPGGYKTEPNNPTRNDGSVFAFAPVDDTAPEMARLVTELRSPAFEAAHPVDQAAYAHYAFVRIHPFADGNGRVARALASAFLYRRPGIPLVVFADQRARYLDALEAADAGRYDDFTRFVADRVMDTVDMLRVQARSATRGRPANLASEIAGLIGSDSGPSGRESDTIAARVFETVGAEFDKRVGEARIPDDVTYQRSTMGSPSFSAPLGFRSPRVGPYAVHIVLWTDSLGDSADARRSYAVFPTSTRSDPWFLVTGPAGNGLEINLRDVYPTSGTAFQIKLRSWVEGEVAELLGELRDAVRVALGEKPE